ncbi:hypothetical protein A3F66_03315 [candidate division TM6 bacterium RIFCSPHIGHO2_12_FULL_32_22]|nr:MAG: hypothetical protein A3F66_03315 [candidate division TM6 bacterium RIFCSPHIGHO2_12_FULL_32_22]
MVLLIRQEQMKNFIPLVIFMISNSKPKIIVVRHGQSDHNIPHIYNSSLNDKVSHLTEKGKEQIKETAKELIKLGVNNKNVSAIYASPFPRTQKTAEILADAGLFDPKRIAVDNRIKEQDAGTLDGKPALEDDNLLKNYGGESYADVDKRIESFLKDLKPKDGEYIIVVTHEKIAKELIRIISGKDKILNTGQFIILNLNK